MIVITNTIKVKKGHGESVAERFQSANGIEQSPGFVRMEVLLTEGRPEHDELKVSTTWTNKASFEGWVNSDSFRKTHAQRNKQRRSDEETQTQECVMLGSQLSTHRVLVSRKADDEA